MSLMNKAFRPPGFALAVIACLALSMPAKGQRSFAGLYELSNTTALMDAYQLTFGVRVFNYSHEDVANARLLLVDSLQLGRTYTTFDAVHLRDGGSVWLTSQVTISRREYEFWMRGGRPALYIQYQNAAGKTLRRQVELTRRPAGEER